MRATSLAAMTVAIACRTRVHTLRLRLRVSCEPVEACLCLMPLGSRHPLPSSSASPPLLLQGGHQCRRYGPGEDPHGHCTGGHKQGRHPPALSVSGGPGGQRPPCQEEAQEGVAATRQLPPNEHCSTHYRHCYAPTLWRTSPSMVAVIPVAVGCLLHRS